MKSFNNVNEVFNNSESLKINVITNELNEKEKEVYNLATDIVMNRLLGQGHDAISEYNLPLNKTAQEYYDILLEKF